MAKTNQASELSITVDGETYLWKLQRRPQWSSDDNAFTGIAISVRHEDGQRDAVIEFPPGKQPRFGAPLLKAERIDPKLVANAIGSAIAAGWEPLSRGKTVVIVVDAEGR